MTTLEVCVDSLNGLKAAIDGGADRIELCSALSIGGLSPSLSLLEAATASPIPVYVMIRPRAGNFLYSASELLGMQREIAQVRDLGLAGVVLGAGSSNGLDWGALEQLTQAAKGMGTTLHRVVDLLPNRLEILKKTSDMGFERVLSSGGHARAIDGMEDLAAQTDAAPTGLSIMPGSGISPENAAQILSRTGASEIHASASALVQMDDQSLVELGFTPPQAKQTSEDIVRALKLSVKN